MDNRDFYRSGQKSVTMPAFLFKIRYLFKVNSYVIDNINIHSSYFKKYNIIILEKYLELLKIIIF